MFLSDVDIPRAIAHFLDVRDNSSQEKGSIRFIPDMHKQHKLTAKAERLLGSLMLEGLLFTFQTKPMGLGLWDYGI